MSDDPYPFESDDDIEIRELDLEDVDALADERITVGMLASENESWRYGHVIVDEAQDLTPMQWRMVMRRVRGRSLTIVGDLAQRTYQTESQPAAASWEDLLPASLVDARRQDLTINYRSPVEIHDLAGAVLADFAPAVTPSRAIRSSGWDPDFRQVLVVNDAVETAIIDALDSVGGLVVVVAADPDLYDVASRGDLPNQDRVRFLTPTECKGLEFDAVVLLEPADIWSQGGGQAQLYIALTRATQRLVVVHQKPLPEALRRAAEPKA